VVVRELFCQYEEKARGIIGQENIKPCEKGGYKINIEKEGKNSSHCENIKCKRRFKSLAVLL
jgi:hypothetical protein